jgi:PPOX class probable F420-dependent enzyme
VPRHSKTPGRTQSRSLGRCGATFDPRISATLLDQPRNAIVGLHRADGSILLTPVWHLFRDGAFLFQVPGDDRKIGMLQRDPRISLLVAEDQHPYRGIEVSGVARVSAEGYAKIGRAIVQRYVAAFDPGADPADYLLEGGVVVRLEAAIMRAWDYADAVYV